ncbi:hypothetical protein V3C99_004768 [Haemonchus contortus]
MPSGSSDHSTPLSCLKKEDGTLTLSRLEMEEVTRRFCTKLYRSTTHVRKPKILTNGTAPRILPSEVRVAITSMKTGTSPGPDKISTDLLCVEGYELHALFATHMTSYLQKEKIPNQWRNSRMVILHKKGDWDDLRNCRSISLLSVLYKLFTKIILTRISRTLDEAQPVEQSGFRKGFSCLDHIQAIAMVIEVCREFRMLLFLTLSTTNAVLAELVDQGVDPLYIRTPADCSSRCSAAVRLFQRSLPIFIGNSVRQSDTISPNYSQPRCSGL